MTFYPSPSKYALADACGFPWGPMRPKWPPRSTYVPSPDALFGQAVSLFVEVMIPWGPEALSLVDDIAAQKTLTHEQTGRLHATAEKIVEEWSGGGITFAAAEVAILFCLATGETKLVTKDEAFRPPNGWISAQLDALFVQHGVLVIRDYKSGFLQARDLRAKSDPQLRAYAMIAARHMRHREVRVELAHVSEDGVRVDRFGFDRLELAGIRLEIDARFKALDAATVPKPGAHCRRCPIVQVCPITGAALERVVTASDAFPIVADPAQITGPDHAASLHRRLALIEEASPRIRAALRQYVLEHGDVPLGDGAFYGRVTDRGKESLSMQTPDAAEIVRRHLGEGAGWTLGVELDASKASLERGARARARELELEGKGAVKKVLDPLLAELRAIGAIRQGAPIEKVTEFKVKNEEQSK